VTARTKIPKQPTTIWLLHALDQAFQRRSWHGTNLRGSLRGLSADQATWRPAPKRRCIADHVLHAAYWKYAARRRLLREKRGTFPLKGSDWFPLPEPWNAATWKRCVRILDTEHAALRAAVETLRDADLARPAGGTGKETAGFLVTGLAAHDLYHTGQIQLLKRLQKRA
jgi:uncharacterized damage-inducible protein DinB